LSYIDVSKKIEWKSEVRIYLFLIGTRTYGIISVLSSKLFF